MSTRASGMSPGTRPPGPAPSTTPDSRSGALSGFVRRHPVGVFFAWFFTVGQALAFIPVVAPSIVDHVPHQIFILASTLIGLLLPALVITRVTEGPEAVRHLMGRSVAWRRPMRWYLLALLIVPLAALLLTAAFQGTPDISAADVVGAVSAGFVLQLVLTTVPNNLWEEVAWTGFVQERLQRRHSALVTALMTGPLFALQHVSLVARNSVTGAVLLLGVLAVLAIPFRYLLAWICDRTGSLLLVGLAHGAGNAATGGSGFGAGLLPRIYPGSAMAVSAHLIVFAVLGLVVMIVTRGRLGAADRPER